MTVVVKTIHKKNAWHYIPHEIRSHPFYFIGLPFLGTLITMFYWLVLCPLLFASLMEYFGSNCCWPIYFWVTALMIFIIILSILVCVWKCSPRKKHESHYKITVEDKDVDSDDMVLNELTPRQTDDEISSENENIEEDKMFPRCSVRQKRPDSLVLSQEVSTRPASQNLSSPLTPRELFFIDLIETANKSCSSMTHTFLENEKQQYSPNDNSLPCSPREGQESCSPSEFFIANVPVENMCTSQVFLYVDQTDSEPQFTITCESATVVD